MAPEKERRVRDIEKGDRVVLEDGSIRKVASSTRGFATMERADGTRTMGWLLSFDDGSFSHELPELEVVIK